MLKKNLSKDATAREAVVGIRRTAMEKLADLTARERTADQTSGAKRRRKVESKTKKEASPGGWATEQEERPGVGRRKRR